MKTLVIYILLIASNFSLFSQNKPQHSKKVVGYYAQWAMYARDYNIMDIEADKLTHLMYAFYNATFDPQTQTGAIASLDTWADYEHNESQLHSFNATVKGNIGDLKHLKQNFPHLKVIISVGGWTKSQNLPAIAASQRGRETLAQSMVNFMTKYTWIDGFDIDWEFPIIGGTEGNEMIEGKLIPAQPHTNNDHRNLVFLLKEIRQHFDANSMQSKELTIALGNNVLNANRQFIGPKNQATYGMTENIMDYCDFVTFFGYDFGGNWYDITSYNAPLFGGDNVNDPLHNANGRNQVLNELVDVYLDDVGIPADKLVMGLPFYGKIFEGVAKTNKVPGMPGLYEAAPRVNNSCSIGQPPKGSWDVNNCENSGAVDFCDLTQTATAKNPHYFLDSTDPTKVSATAAAAGWVRYWDDVAKVPYLYNANADKFVSYDDPQSIDIKVKYALAKKLGGVMIWELSQDARNSDKGLLDTADKTMVNATFDMTLNFKDQNQVALQGVSVTLKDENNKVVEILTSNASGQVVFDDKTAFVPYTIEYSLSGYSFLPSSVTYQVLEFESDKTIQVIGSNQVYVISGSVKENMVLLPNVDVVLSDNNGQELERNISTDGNFSFNGVIDGLDYSLTAEKEYYSFTNLTYSNLSADQTNQELTASRNTHTISGKVTILQNGLPAGLEGVLITLNGNGTNRTTTTDKDGNYTFTVDAGYDYVVTPSMNSKRFKPTSSTYSLLNSDTTANFEENKGLIYGTVKNGSNPVAGAKLTLIVPWTDKNHPYKTIPKTTNAKGEYFYEDTEFSGYKVISSLKLETFDNNGATYYPTDLTNIAITNMPQEYNFNSQLATPEITINSPNTPTLTNTYGQDIDLEALVNLSFDDGSTTLSSVSFKMDGVVVATTNNAGVYSGTWSPADADYNTPHTFLVEAVSSNSKTASKSFDFSLSCTGASCPNMVPSIVWDAPSNVKINQNQGFKSIPIQVTVTDTDGSVTAVTIKIDGQTHTMSSGANNTYTHAFTPSNHQQYPVVITATDNEGDTATLNQTLTITDSKFVPLPSRVNVGYYHSWDNANAPFIYLKDIIDTKYNVVVYSFIETQNSNGYTPVLTIHETAANYQTNGAFDKAKFKADIKALQDKGIPVLVSVGGQNGHVELNTVTEKDTFVNGVVSILNEYGFDGLDIDFEGSSMNFGAGALTDFSYSSVSNYPKLKNVIDAIKEIDTQMGSGFHITAAPEVQYVQQGSTAFANNWGSFLPVIDNIRDILDYIHVQLYNIGATNGVKGLDGKNYYQGSSDLIVSACESLIQGFTTAGPAIKFNGLRSNQIAIGLPATNNCTAQGGAAGGGFVTTSDVEKAIKYLTKGTSFGGSYSLQGGPYPNLRGAMTWSINWDKSTACGSGVYEYTNNIHKAFSATLSNKEIAALQTPVLFPNPVSSELKIQWLYDGQVELIITDFLGRDLMKKAHDFGNHNKLQLNAADFPRGVLFVQLKTKQGQNYVRRIIAK